MGKIRKVYCPTGDDWTEEEAKYNKQGCFIIKNLENSWDYEIEFDDGHTMPVNDIELMDPGIYEEEKIQKIKDLYKDEIDPDTIDTLAKVARCYGGTVASRALLDLYDSLIYGEEPKGPKQ